VTLVTASTGVSPAGGQVTVAQLETLWQKSEQFAFQCNERKPKASVSISFLNFV